MKYLFVTGGCVSGLGKGVTISSIGVVLKSMGIRVTAIKIDPYLNQDAGTLSPYEHGETFVLDDGGEADLDLGNYERFEELTLTREHNITTGKVYMRVLSQERAGDFLGKTVQVVPHVTDCIMSWIEEVARVPVDGSGLEPEVCLVEVGGTVGDIESAVFLEAIRQFQFRVAADEFCLVHVCLVPVVGSVGEQKTKPAQHSAKELRSAGLSPDVIVCRSTDPLEEATRRKIASFCHTRNVVALHDVPSVLHVPLMLAEQGVAATLLERLRGLAPPHAEPQLADWRRMALAADGYEQELRIAIVGKYTGLQDAYLSVIKALKHAAMAVERRLALSWIEASDLEPATEAADPEAHAAAWARLREAQGVLLPGGFGERGVEGKILCAHHCRTERVPCLGVCLGMQLMAVEFARNVLGWAGATSAEFDEQAERPVVVFMPEVNPDVMGGTMRLGAHFTLFEPAAGGGRSLAQDVYGNDRGASERHRHRYEINPELVAELQAAGLFFSGMDEQRQRMEMLELADRDAHPFYFGLQAHPEYTSRPRKPSPPFLGLARAALGLPVVAG